MANQVYSSLVHATLDSQDTSQLTRNGSKQFSAWYCLKMSSSGTVICAIKYLIVGFTILNAYEKKSPVEMSLPPPSVPKFKSLFLDTIFWGVSLSHCTFPFFIWRIQKIHELLILIIPPDSPASNRSVISTIIVCIVYTLLFHYKLVNLFEKFIHFLLLWWNI